MEFIYTRVCNHMHCFLELERMFYENITNYLLSSSVILCHTHLIYLFSFLATAITGGGGRMGWMDPRFNTHILGFMLALHCLPKDFEMPLRSKNLRCRVPF